MGTWGGIKSLKHTAWLSLKGVFQIPAIQARRSEVRDPSGILTHLVQGECINAQLIKGSVQSLQFLSLDLDEPCDKGLSMRITD